MDDEVHAYVDDLRRGGPQRVAAATEKATERGRRVLRAYAERMASMAVREVDRQNLVRALVALAVGGLGDNDREALMAMPLIENSAKRLELDTEVLFEEVAGIIGHPGSLALVRWLTRSEHDRSLSAFKYIESRDEGGFRYKLVW